MHRLFIALRPPSQIRALLLGAMGAVPLARWQDDQQLHLTIRYIGEVDRPKADDVCAALGRVHSESPTIAVAGVGRFEKAGRTDALWAGIAPRAPLADIHARVDRALQLVGIAPDSRTYLPHITLARLPRSSGVETAVERFLADRLNLSSPAFAPDALLLFESHLGREGARYETIARYRFSTPKATN